MKCSQCGRPAVVRISEKEMTIDLCLDCNLKFEQAQSLEFDRLTRQHNFLVSQADDIIGLPVPSPRYAPPPKHVFHVGDLILSNIKIDRSAIGILNTGTIGTVDGAVTVLKEHGETDAGDAIAGLTEALVKAQDINAEQKKHLMEILSLIATEATAPKEKRRSSVMRSMLLELSTIIGGVSGLGQLWQQFGPLIVGLFR